MPGGKILSKTGNALVTKQGHTSSGAFGSNENAKARWGTSTRNLGK
jgi:hypothetical protein